MKRFKAVFYTSILIFFFFACKSTKGPDSTNTDDPSSDTPSFTVRSNSETVIPLQMGNYWVYKYTNYNETVKKDQLDTIKVDRVTDHGDVMDYQLSNYNVWAVKNGIIHRRCWGRTPNRNIENSFIKPLYFRTEKAEMFDECRGDMILRSKITPLKEGYDLFGLQINNCYEITQQSSNNKTIIADGIGIVKEEYYDHENKLVGEKILVANFLH